jgi:hypothetical protein
LHSSLAQADLEKEEDRRARERIRRRIEEDKVPLVPYGVASILLVQNMDC